MFNRLTHAPFMSGYPAFYCASGSLLDTAELYSSGSNCVYPNHAYKVLVPPAHLGIGCSQSNTADSRAASDCQICGDYMTNSQEYLEGSSASALDEDGFQMQQHIRLQQRLRQVERQIRSSLNPSTIFGATVVETAQLFEAKQVSLLQCEAGSQCWRPIAQYCQNQTLSWQRPLSIALAQFPALLEQLRQGHPLSVSAAQLSGVEPKTDTSTADPSQLSEIQRWLTDWPGNWLLIPVGNRHPTTNFLNGSPAAARSQTLLEDLDTSAYAEQGLDGHQPGGNDDVDSCWGVMAIALPESGTWISEAIAAAQSITLEMALALEQANQYQELIAANQELQKLALSDGLTSLANRRRFDEHLIDEWQRLARDQRPLSLILCDLDHFKRYNDAFGHPAGDRCLIRVARALLNGPQRPADLVARYGGEEFAIILPNTDTHGAWRIARKVHSNIRDLEIPHAPDNEKAYVTVTMGISTVVPSHSSTAQLLVQTADLALYHAKQQGRDRTYVHALYNTVDNTADSLTLNADDDLQPQIIRSPDSGSS